ncbi:MAG: DNA methyltransferase [Candidatus Zixiibacteriota bacterium]
MKKRALRNRTITCSKSETRDYGKSLLNLSTPANIEYITNKIIHQDFAQARAFLPAEFVDLLILDPPYNLTKNYNGNLFRSKQAEEYKSWFTEIVCSLKPFLKPDASVYVCSEWKTSSLIFPILDTHFHIRNRITWEREKGRGAKSNWKNNTEDIWYCTCGNDYYFDAEAVKLRRNVKAPYRTDDGQPKDWEECEGKKYRLTHPSNFWSDISVPFWSMPENTDHPTQKPEKVMAKLILAGSREGDFVFDPFLGSGTTAVVAKKLNRRFCGIELNHDYCCWAAKRLNLAEKDTRIQGYTDGVFWERNSLKEQKRYKDEFESSI